MKKEIVLLVFVFMHVFISYGQENNTKTITVTVSGMKSDKGAVFVALYNSEIDFLEKEFKGAIVTIVDRKSTAVFKNIKNGIYAISVFHDSNDNKKLDTNFLGIPKEPIGTSNNAKGFMGPPKFKNAKFEVTENIMIPIEVK